MLGNQSGIPARHKFTRSPLLRSMRLSRPIDGFQRIDTAAIWTVRSLLFAAVLPIGGAAQGPPQWRLREELRLSESLTGGVTFTRVAAIVPRPDGSFYVVDSGEKSIRLFGPDGRLLKSIGREGAGPGEFRVLSAAGTRADTLWAMDSRLRRVSFFSPEGNFLRSNSIPALPSSRSIFQAIVEDACIIQLMTFVTVSGTNHGSDNAVVRLGLTGSVDTIASLRFGVGDWLHRGEGPTPFAVMLPNPFNDGSLFDADSKGQHFTIVHRVVRSNQPSQFEVVRIDATGSTLWRRAFAYTPMHMSAAVKDSVARARGIGPTARFPNHMPPVSRVLTGEDGTVWLRREELRPDRMSEWNVLDATGRLIGRFETRRPVHLLAASAHSVYAAVLDEMDVPLVIRYAVTPVR